MRNLPQAIAGAFYGALAGVTLVQVLINLAWIGSRLT